MRSIGIFILFLVVSKQSFASDTLKCPGGYFDSTLAMTVFDFPDTDPAFPGDDPRDLGTFFNEHLVFPETTRNICGYSKVIISFVVSADGKLLNPQIEESRQPGMAELEAEVLRVFYLMPDWIPGTCMGQNVAVKYRIPVQVCLK